MSYILDALRRAQAERARGTVPGLDAQAAPVPATAALAGRRAPPSWFAPGAAAGGALLALIVAGGAWWALPHQAPVVSVASVAAQDAAAIAIASPAQGAAPLHAPSPPPVVSAPLPVEASSAPATPITPKAALLAVQAVPRQLPARPAPVPLAAAPAAPAPAAADASSAAAAAAPAAGSVLAQGDLPAAVREQLPALQVSGATYSNNPAHRMAIVNGQVLSEGDQAAPGLVLEKIERGRTVWTFRGYRYAVAPQ